MTAVPPLMSIGMFARSCLLSVKALRAYHERGILVPASVDPVTGYRAYHPGQLADAISIRRLRSLDVPLDVVKEILEARDPEVTSKLLAEHQNEMQARLDDTARIVGELQSLNAAATSPAVHVTTVGHSDAIAVSGRVVERDFAGFLSAAFPRLGAALGTGGLRRSGPTTALYGLEVDDLDEQPVTACIPVESPAPTSLLDRVDLIELPAETVAVAVHEGAYDDLGDSYAALGAWVAFHATSTGSPIREVYRVSFAETSDPSEFRTEIQWPIAALTEETS